MAPVGREEPGPGESSLGFFGRRKGLGLAKAYWLVVSVLGP